MNYIGPTTAGESDQPQPEDRTVDSNASNGEPWYRRRAAWIALPIIGLLVIWLGFKWLTAGPQGGPPPPSMVTVSAPLSRMVTDWDDYVGRFEASQAVEVRPRVSGQLVALHFKDGDIVKKGQLLFTIDPRPFTAALNEAQARVGAQSTALALARSDLARAQRLIADEAVSAQEVDQLKATVRSAEANLAAAQAQVRSRALDVEFAYVRAPVTGRVSDRRVDIGNLVSADTSGAAGILTTINALDPIYFSFDGSEALYLKQRRQKQQAQTVEIRLQDEADYKWRGRVDFTDNAIDNGSGTIRGRAVISNPDYFLIPGMFGNMRLSGGVAHQALLVPDASVVTDQARKVVWVLGKDNSLTARPVTIGGLVGGLRIIRSGLGPQDKVVIQGMQFAMPGAKVNPVVGKIAPAKAGASAPPATEPASSQATFVGE